MILVDTGPLVAICNAKDALHATAVRDLAVIGKQQLVAVQPVLVEACALLPYAVQRRRLHRFLTDFSVTSFQVDDELALWDEVFRWLGHYAEHDPDWTDGYLVVAASRESRARVWSYDREFATIWRKPNGAPIPLAIH